MSVTKTVTELDDKRVGNCWWYEGQCGYVHK